MPSLFGRTIATQLHTLTFLFDRVADRSLRASCRVSLSQFLFLLALERSQETSQRGLATSLNISEAAISRHVAVLRRKALITCAVRRRDGRTRVLLLTNDGASCVRMGAMHLDRMLDRAFSTLTTSERSTSIHLLRRLEDLLGLLEARRSAGRETP